jgi:hypothetical protein
MTSLEQDTAVLESVRKQYQKAEEEIRQAAEALRRLVTASDQLDAARTTLGEASDGLRGDGRALLAATETLQRAVTTIEGATFELAKADPARLADVVDSSSTNLREQVRESANGLRLHAERTESWQQQVLVTLGQVTGQIRQDVRGEIGPPLAVVGRGIEEAATASARGFAALSVTLGQVNGQIRQDVRGELSPALAALGQGIEEAAGATASGFASLSLAVEHVASTSARDAAGIRSALVDAEAAYHEELSRMNARYERERAALERTLEAAERRVLLEVRLVGGLILLGFVVVLSLMPRT